MYKRTQTRIIPISDLVQTGADSGKTFDEKGLYSLGLWRADPRPSQPDLPCSERNSRFKTSLRQFVQTNPNADYSDFRRGSSHSLSGWQNSVKLVSTQKSLWFFPVGVIRTVCSVAFSLTQALFFAISSSKKTTSCSRT